MYSRNAQKVKIHIKGRDATHTYLRATLTMHNSWLEIRGQRIKREPYKAKQSWDKSSRGVIGKDTEDRIYPEASIEFIEVDDKKVDMRQYKKEDTE